ncbi:MAG TPA: hypothetical protein VME23_09425 [Terracidiphilus sp.]|nr:hypothetical protein [Terracidiphilus sp.]
MADEQARCIEKLRHSKVKIHDPGTGRSGILLNPLKVQVRRIKMDGCLAPVGAKAADFVVSMPRLVDVIVELKGKNVDHAVEQIESSRLFWKTHGEHAANQLIGAWILCAQYPRASQKIKRYEERFRAHGGIFIVSTHNGEERQFSEFVPRHP